MWYWLIFGVGASVGSFVNVAITRSIEGKDFVNGRSRCDHCHKYLAWYDMIPIFSFLWYRGQSRCCGKRLTWRHPLIETLFGALFVWWGAMGVFFFHLVNEPLSYIQPLFWLATGILLTVVLVSDYYYQLIPTLVLNAGVGLVVLYRLVLYSYGAYQAGDLIISLAAGLGAGGFIWLLRVLTRGRGMGEGDITLALWLGLLLGYPRIVVALWMAFVGGAVVGIWLVVTKKKKLKQAVPFGPFLIMGAMVALWWGGLIVAQFD